MSRYNPVDADDAATGSCHSASDVTSQRRHGPRDVAELLVRQCKSWSTKLSGHDDATDNLPTSNTLSVSSAASSSTSPGCTVSRPPPSPRPSLTTPTRPGDRRSSLLKSDSAAEPPSAYFFTSTSTEDVVVDTVVPGTAGSDTSSGRGSASPDTRPSSRGKGRFKKLLRPLRRTQSAGCSVDFQKLEDAGHKTPGVQQVTLQLI